MKELMYKCHSLTINELPNFKNPEEKLYRGTTIIDGKKWEKDGSAVYLIESWFRDKIDNLYKGRSYAEVFKAWNSRYKRIEYKGRWLSITIRERFKDNKVVYLGEFCSKDYKKNKSIESIHYHKLVSKFEKFIDEYCTDWKNCSSIPYKGYMLWISEDIDKENFFGTCEVHKNSTFKCISKSYREIEDKFIARIDQILYHKQGLKVVNSKEDRLRQLETQITALQEELEKVKNEKDVLVYKGVILEYGPDPAIREGWMVGRIKDAPIEADTFYAMYVGNMKDYFETYIDNLEKSAKIYCQLMGLEYKESV